MSDKKFLRLEMWDVGTGKQIRVEKLGSKKELIIMLMILATNIAECVGEDVSRMLLAMSAAGPLKPDARISIVIPQKKEGQQ